MITDKDERTFTNSKYIEEFKNAIDIAFAILIKEKMSLTKYEYGSRRMKPKLVTQKFDKIICQNGGFEIDGRTCRHAHGIGNNNEYDIVDKELEKVASFYCNSDMHGGVYVGVTMNGEKLKSYFISERSTKNTL